MQRVEDFGTSSEARIYMLWDPVVQARDSGSGACLLVVVAGHVLLHALPHCLVLAGGAADHSAAHPTLQ